MKNTNQYIAIIITLAFASGLIFAGYSVMAQEQEVDNTAPTEESADTIEDSHTDVSDESEDTHNETTDTTDTVEDHIDDTDTVDDQAGGSDGDGDRDTISDTGDDTDKITDEKCQPKTEEEFRAIRNNMSRWDWDLENGNITIRNDNDCAVPTGLKVFKVYNEEDPQIGQTLFDHDIVVLAPGETRKFSVEVPSCRYQLDALIYPNEPYTSAKLIKAQIRFGLSVCESETPPPPPPGDLTCPLDVTDKDILVDFLAPLHDAGREKIYADHGLEASRIATGAHVPHGIYRVTLAAFDNHAETGGQGQQHEQYHVELWNTHADPVIARSHSTPDIGDDEEWVIEHVNEHLTIGRDANRVAAAHSFYPGHTGPESLTPVCAKFSPVEVVEDPAVLTLIKEVKNDDGGHAEPEDFPLFVVTKSNDHKIEMKTGVPKELHAGTYVAREEQLSGYTTHGWGGDCTPDGQVMLEPGDDKVCWILNNDIEAGLADVSIEKAVTPDHGEVGQVFNYTLTYKNLGTFAAGHTTIKDTGVPVGILGGLTITKQPEHGTCQIIDGGISCDLGTLLVGAHGTIEYTAEGIHKGEFVNTAVIHTSTEEVDLHNNKDSETVIVGDGVTEPHTNVAIEKSVTPSSGDVGQSFTYTLVYENTTDIEAAHVEIHDVASPSDVLTNYTITKQPEHGSCTANSDGITCNLGALVGGADGTITYTAGSVKAGQVENIATITTTSEEETLSDNEDFAVVTVNSGGGGGGGDEIDLSILKSVNPTSGNVTQVFNYTLTYANIGDESAAGTTIEDVATSTGVILENYTITKQPEHGSCTVNGDGISCTLGTLEEGENGTVEYSATSVAEGTVTNTAAIATTDDEDNLQNNEDTATVTVEAGNGGGGSGGGSGGGGGGGGGSSSDPDVFLFGGGEVAGAAVSLAQVPYTGFGDVMLMILYFLVLLGVAGLITYAVFRYRALRSSQSTKDDHTERLVEEATQSMTPPTPTTSVTSATQAPAPVTATPVPVPTPTDVSNKQQAPEQPASAGDTTLDQLLESKAHKMHVLMSVDGRRVIQDAAKGDSVKAIALLERAVRDAEKRFPREDGWLLLNKVRLEEVLFTTSLSTVPLFIQWLVNGDEQQIFSFLRSLSQQGRTPKDFIREVVSILDALYRARIDGIAADVDPSVSDLVDELSREDLEHIVTHLTRGIDGGYSSPMDGVKIAVMRIVGDRATRAASYTPQEEYKAQSADTTAVEEGRYNA